MGWSTPPLEGNLGISRKLKYAYAFEASVSCVRNLSMGDLYCDSRPKYKGIHCNIVDNSKRPAKDLM